jgi:hypothetical protein
MPNQYDALARAIVDARLFIVRLSMLAPFASPSAWQVDPVARDHLHRLARLMPVAVITSRPVHEARDQLKQLSNLHYVGLSGAEVWPARQLLPEPDTRLVGTANEIRELIAEHKRELEDAGARLEPHGVIHIGDGTGRENPRAREVADRVRDEAERRSFFVSQDLLTYKIRPAEMGTAILKTLEVTRADRVTYLGYDESDVAAFHVLRDERDQGRLSEVCKVGARYAGHACPVEGHADVYVSGFHGVRELIAQLATALTPSDDH